MLNHLGLLKNILILKYELNFHPGLYCDQPFFHYCVQYPWIVQAFNSYQFIYFSFCLFKNLSISRGESLRPPQQSSLADTLSPRFYGAQLWHCVNIGTAGDYHSHFTVLCKSVVQHVTDLMHHCMNTHEGNFKEKWAVQINHFHCKPPQPHHELAKCSLDRTLIRNVGWMDWWPWILVLGCFCWGRFDMNCFLGSGKCTNTSLTTLGMCAAPSFICSSPLHLSFQFGPPVPAVPLSFFCGVSSSCVHLLTKSQGFMLHSNIRQWQVEHSINNYANPGLINMWKYKRRTNDNIERMQFFSSQMKVFE